MTYFKQNGVIINVCEWIFLFKEDGSVLNPIPDDAEKLHGELKFENEKWVELNE